MFKRVLTALLLALVPLASQAVRLSISTTNQYVYTTPLTTNLVGIGMGETRDYVIPRYEDIAFLREAYAERFYAVGANAPIGYTLPFPNSHVPINPFDGLRDSVVANLWPESFDPEDGGWREYWYLMRGVNNSYVATNMAFASYGMLDCSSNWTFRIDREHDVREDYMPHVSTFGNRILPPDLRTNDLAVTEIPIVSLAVTNYYHNISLAKTIATHPQEGLHAQPTMTKSVVYSRSGNDATYEWEWYTDGEHEGAYIKSYLSLTPWNDRSESQMTEALPNCSLYSWVTHYSAIGWRQTKWTIPYEHQRINVLAPYLRTKGSRITKSVSNSVVRVYCPIITTNNIGLCSNIRCYAVCGATRTVTDTRYSRFDGSDRTITNKVDYAFATKQTSVAVTSEAHGNSVVFSTDLDLCDLLGKFREHFGETDSMWAGRTISDVSPDAQSVPQTYTAGYPPDSCVGNHEETRTVSIDYIRLIFIFDRDFNAKVITTP